MNKTILVVDDKANVRTLLREYLTSIHVLSNIPVENG